MKTLDLSIDGGTLFGYVVDADQPNVLNYLSRHTNLADAVMGKLRTYKERVALLSNMMVDEDRRGTGIGAQLMSEFMEFAEQEGATVYVLICDVNQSQQPGFDLKEWYESFGFTATIDTGEGPLMVMPEYWAEQLTFK
jgi:GNAT superfamily N-acetyltransferase